MLSFSLAHRQPDHNNNYSQKYKNKEGHPSTSRSKETLSSRGRILEERMTLWALPVKGENLHLYVAEYMEAVPKGNR